MRQISIPSEKVLARYFSNSICTAAIGTQNDVTDANPFADGPSKATPEAQRYFGFVWMDSLQFGNELLAERSEFFEQFVSNIPRYVSESRSNIATCEALGCIDTLSSQHDSVVALHNRQFLEGSNIQLGQRRFSRDPFRKSATRVLFTQLS